MVSPSPQPPNDADPSSAEARKRIGEVVSGRYALKQVLGEGGMGAVYLAEHTHMRKRVALKLLHAEMIDNPEVLARFEREAVAASHIEHPNVAAATDFGRTDDGGFFLVLEYLEGASLREVLKRSGAMPSMRALHIARQIAKALERAHDAGIVHRDLKPENVMIIQKGDDPDFVKVLDFGIAKVSPEIARGDSSQPLTKMGTVLGTPEYMAPEQALGEPVSPASDLYALGVMLYEMLTGKHPFDPPDRLTMLSFHIVAPVPTMRDRAPEVDVPPLVEAVVRRLLEKDAKARYASSRALVAAIDEAASSSGILLIAAPPSGANAGALMTPPPASIQVAPRQSLAGETPAWRSNDALAQTSLGLPQATPPPASAAKLPPAINDVLHRFKALPRNAQVGIAAAVPLVLVAFLTVLVIAFSGKKRTTIEGPDGSIIEVITPETAKPKLAPTERLAGAVALGPEALEALAKEFPDDRAIDQKLVVAYHARGNSAEALRVARDLARKDPAKAEDADVVGAVAAIAEKNTRSDTDEQAFALLENDLGSAGVDALVEMSNKPFGVTKQRALQSLAKPGARAHASKAALAYIDLASAHSCTAKKEILDRVKDDGDSRVLPQLKTLKATRGCGFLRTGDCWPCLHRDSALADTITAVESRAK